MSNDWPSDDSSYEGWSSCVVVACEHSDDAFTCEICLEKQPSFKKYNIFDYRIYDQLILK